MHGFHKISATVLIHAGYPMIVHAKQLLQVDILWLRPDAANKSALSR
ncbi:hypothetical protein AFE_2291 [Acidithiobacillus ferrooxidans ATCC 23270]|uniref:Uncharacterized protein n=1 Tax=Acidithiobacillus ferrooxidans (strain ATCC 23270 / DSM 14882 / CIP 104768 / NCIMB 8455) TaxID=243159 RepID=B7J663_ACIF2|nr:hypothetical protein AFE_2291 [Acidithiobacillus ferrooxidans ATCC 23270]